MLSLHADQPKQSPKTRFVSSDTPTDPVLDNHSLANKDDIRSLLFQHGNILLRQVAPQPTKSRWWRAILMSIS